MATVFPNKEWRERFEAAITAAEDIARKYGWPIKEAVGFYFDTSIGDPYWTGLDEKRGTISINPLTHDPEAAAHEIAHGIHEALRKIRVNAMKGVDGEKFTQIIRHQAQKDLTLPWTANQDDEYVQNYGNDFPAFAKWLNGL